MCGRLGCDNHGGVCNRHGCKCEAEAQRLGLYQYALQPLRADLPLLQPALGAADCADFVYLQKDRRIFKQGCVWISEVKTETLKRFKI